ncbi:hypothetical protein C1H46_024497 [Malus baccata]|uniref:Heat shock factor binding protein n=1 Tax=Malus baccata TaxID=106549 RepID=A0A540LUH1_MALBA|nr:hypothetical protein C1H46_024497 [Malus baccata]
MDVHCGSLTHKDRRTVKQDDTDDPKQSTADMTAFFNGLCGLCFEICSNPAGSCFLDLDALDEMGSRIDELEQSINDLRAEMGVEGSPSPSASLKPNIEPKSADDSAKE